MTIGFSFAFSSQCFIASLLSAALNVGGFFLGGLTLGFLSGIQSLDFEFGLMNAGDLLIHRHAADLGVGGRDEQRSGGQPDQ